MRQHRPGCGWLLVILFATLTAAEPVAGQEAEAAKLKTGAAEIEISGRVQTQFNTTTVEGEPPSRLFLRRVRLEVAVKVNDLVSGEIQPDFADDDLSLKDAFLRFSFSPDFQLLIGQAFLPFSLLEQTTSRRILPIERGAAIRGIRTLSQAELISGLDYADRDVGLQILGEPRGVPLDLEYAAGIFRGPLHGEVGARDSYQYAARLSLAPFSRTRLGAGWSSRHFAREVSEEPAAFALRRGAAWEVDLEYGSFDPGIHVFGEAAIGDFDPFSDAKFFGAQAWLGYRTRPWGIISALEPIFRASYGRVTGEVQEEDRHGGTLLTPGLNLYFGGWNRVMVNYDFWLPNGSRDREGSFKAQFQMVF